MISTNESVKLTAEQLRQIEVVQARVANLQSETALATKTLTETKSLVSSAIKNKEYQEELLVNLTRQVNVKKNELESVTEAVKAATSVLLEKQELAKVCNVENQLHKEELKKDRVLLDEELQKHAKNAEALRADRQALEEDRKLVDKAKNAFEEAIKHVQWR